MVSILSSRTNFQGDFAPFARLLRAVKVRSALHLDRRHRRCVDRSACPRYPHGAGSGAGGRCAAAYPLVHGFSTHADFQADFAPFARLLR